MSLYRRGQIWWGRWRFAGEPPIAESSGSSDKAAAQEWHDNRAAELWRIRKLGERAGVTFAAATLECVELADFMIAQRAAFRERHAAESASVGE